MTVDEGLGEVPELDPDDEPGDEDALPEHPVHEGEVEPDRGDAGKPAA